jgi:hypothetical protein
MTSCPADGLLTNLYEFESQAFRRISATLLTIQVDVRVIVNAHRGTKAVRTSARMFRDGFRHNLILEV